MKLLFSHSYYLRFDPKQFEGGHPYPPLGTLYAAAMMRSLGYDVALHDVMFSHGPGELAGAVSKHDPDVLIIYDDGFNYLTKMCLTNMREAAFDMIRFASRKGIKVIVSSSDSTDRYAEYLGEGADFIILGEAEASLGELTAALNIGANDFFAIKGIAFKKEGSVVKNPSRPVMKDLDSLAFPAWDLINISVYRDTWMKSSGYFSINMATTRGCPFKCNWCAKPIYGNRYNSRSPANVVNEIRELQKTFAFDHIWFCDDIFGLKPGWVKEFSMLLKQENIKIRFKIQARADLLLQEETIAALADAGCENVWMGAESGSQKILDAMDKGITVEQIHAATMLLKHHGIKPSFFIQFGYPGETRDDIRLTRKMINTLLPHEIGISVSYPLPGTRFYERVKSELDKKANWTDSNELALMFTNTFRPDYYKQLHTYVHRSYRKHLAINNFGKILLNPFKLNYSMVKKALSGFYYFPAALIAKMKLNVIERRG